MRISLGTARALRIGISPLIVGALFAIAAPAGDTSAQSRRASAIPGYSQRLCYNAPGARNGLPDLDRSDVSRDYLARIASGGDSCANVPQRPGMQNAQFYAGQANRILGEGPPKRPEALTAAANLFLSVVTSNYSESELRNAGRLELARVYRLQGNFTQAEEQLRQVQDQAGLSRAIAYERAMVVVSNTSTENVNTDARRVAEVGALNHLNVFADADLSERPNQYVRQRGPQELARLASRLGRESMDQPMTLENTQAAVEKFALARRALLVLGQTGMTSENAEIFASLGRAQLRLAGHAAGEPEFQCRPEVVNVSQLQAPSESFEEARRRDQNLATAYWGIGCVQMARGETTNAIGSFTRAVELSQNSPGAGGHQLALARAFVAAGPSYLGNAIQAYDRALSSVSSAPDVHVEVAAAYLGIPFPIPEREIRTLRDRVEAARGNAGNIEQARQRLGRALNTQTTIPRPQQDNPNALAYLLRGMILQGAPSSNVAHARYNLQESAYLNQNWRGEANYQLSLLEQGQGRAAEAVDAADQAVLAGASRGWYRTQACLARIRFWLDLREPRRVGARDYCAVQTKGTPAENAEAYLNQGMYQLRLSFTAVGGDQNRAWASAIEAFQTGLRVLGDANRVPGGSQLRARLARGNNDAYYCSGLGLATSVQVDPGNPQDAANAGTFFHTYGLANGDGSTRCRARR